MALKDEAMEWDILVIGGGATGVGVALDAATRGLSVALVEGEDFSSGSELTTRYPPAHPTCSFLFHYVTPTITKINITITRYKQQEHKTDPWWCAIFGERYLRRNSSEYFSDLLCSI